MSKDNAIDNYSGAHAGTPNKKQARRYLTAPMTAGFGVFYPYYRLNEEGYEVDVLTAKGGAFEGNHGLVLSKANRSSLPSLERLRADLPNFFAAAKAPATLRNDNKCLRS